MFFSQALFLSNASLSLFVLVCASLSFVFLSEINFSYSHTCLHSVVYLVGSIDISCTMEVPGPRER